MIDKKMGITLGVIFSAALFVGCTSPQVQTSVPQVNQPNGQAESVMMKKDTIEDAMEQSEGSYVVFSQSAYDEAKEKRRVIFFHATWCPTCKEANADFEANSSKIPDDVVVFKTDYDSERELKQKYGITYQHTFVLVDEDGNEVTKWNGGGVDMLRSKVN